MKNIKFRREADADIHGPDFFALPFICPPEELLGEDDD